MHGRRSEVLALSLISGINQAWARLADIWDSIGITENQRVERTQTAKKHIEGLLNQMILEEENLKQRIKNNISIFQEQLEDLSEEMSLEPFQLEDGLTVLQMEKNLRMQVKALEKERSKRLKEQRGLRRLNLDLCEELGATPYSIPARCLLSREQLWELQEHIRNLSEEKRRRVEVLSELREGIRGVIAEIGLEGEYDDRNEFLLTHKNIKALRLLLCQLEMKKKSLIANRDELKEKAVRLWNRLEYPEQVQSEFQDHLHTTLCGEIRQWQTAVDHLVVLQKAKLQEVIQKIRKDLVEVWDKCMFSPEQRKSFHAHFHNGNFTEELLASHDEELLRMKSFYEEAHPLLEMVEKWNTNWVIFQDFEKKASDPNRFSNRGGTLLKEAKERVRVQKLLPKLEEELRAGEEAWERDHGSVFLVWGQRPLEHIACLREEHQLQRQKDRNERMTKKSEQTPLNVQSKRPPIGVNGGMTPSKTKKTTSRSNGIGSSSSNGPDVTFLSVSVKLTRSSSSRKKTLDTSRHPPLPENNCLRKHSGIGSHQKFTDELSKVNGDASLNSTKNF
ncbi:hypothetical protein GJAV_G00025400 [Gymnothorax javanicus]|nr:hypothetical protein GJAV_G00025400 [Gymnothorax javanicus]